MALQPIETYRRMKGTMAPECFGRTEQDLTKSAFEIPCVRTLSDEDVQLIQQTIAAGHLVIARLSKRDLDHVVTVQDWTDVDSKFACAIQYIQSLYAMRDIYDFQVGFSPTGYLNKGCNGTYQVVMQDGNHRVALAFSVGSEIGVRMLQTPTTAQRMYSFNCIYRDMNQARILYDR